jgi:hypothetical protein
MPEKEKNLCVTHQRNKKFPKNSLIRVWKRRSIFDPLMSDTGIASAELVSAADSERLSAISDRVLNP